MSHIRKSIERAWAVGRSLRERLSGAPGQGERDRVVVFEACARSRVSRTPSRRVVGELTSALVATPIALGVAAMIAAPWPKPTDKSITTSRPPAVVRVASLTRAQITDALERAAHGAKLVVRATPNAINVASAEATPSESLASAPRVSEPRLPDRRMLHAAASRTSVSNDGRLIIEGERVKLSGVEMPKATAMCRRLDGALVPCLDRVIARLAIITQMRAVECRTQIDAFGERTGQCQAGKIDLTRDLIHARLARPVETASVVLSSEQQAPGSQ